MLQANRWRAEEPDAGLSGNKLVKGIPVTEATGIIRFIRDGISAIHASLEKLLLTEEYQGFGYTGLPDGLGDYLEVYC